MPRELTPLLGEWGRAGDGSGNVYWRNELLGISSWKDPRHTTNLFQASVDGNLFFVQLYIYAGGRIDVTDSQGCTALHYACSSGTPQLALCLLQGKAAVNSLDLTGCSPLHWACHCGHAAVVRLLLEAAADPDQRNSNGDTPMHEAAAAGTLETLHWLVLAQADPTLRNNESRTPAEVAWRAGAQDAAHLLQRHEGMQRGDLDPHGDVSQRAALAIAADHANSSSESEADESASLALAVVRAARPLLRGLQWLANIVPKRADLGASNGYCFDASTGQWVLAPVPSEAEDSSATDDDTWLPVAPQRTSSPQRKSRVWARSRRRLREGRANEEL
mmetsp:Transcript_25930/g.71355  ORF Transcript_25930/g.71355 Transcript_25930/m.71355 type:complete len:332 (+) Transcript_25930:1129-2124(+)